MSKRYLRNVLVETLIMTISGVCAAKSGKWWLLPLAWMAGSAIGYAIGAVVLARKKASP